MEHRPLARFQRRQRPDGAVYYVGRLGNSFFLLYPDRQDLLLHLGPQIEKTKRRDDKRGSA